MYLKLIDKSPREIIKYYEKPFYVYLSLSNICNANCVFCEVRTNKEKKCNINVFSLIDELASLGTQYIHFTGGGEPFVNDDIFEYLDYLFENPKCELEYNNDFEFLIAVVLSAQTTDKKVNSVTKELFSKYDMYSLKDAPINDLINILKPLGMSIKKASFIKNISKEITETYNGIIPDDINTLMKMDGVGRKTANLVLSTLYNKPYIAVDTHVERVCKRLNLVSKDANVLEVEQELYNIIPKDRLNKTHHQLVLFGRYYCKSIKPKCDTCKLKEICKKEKS